MGARSAGGGAPRCDEARTDGVKTKIKISTNVKVECPERHPMDFCLANGIKRALFHR